MKDINERLKEKHFSKIKDGEYIGRINNFELVRSKKHGDQMIKLVLDVNVRNKKNPLYLLEFVYLKLEDYRGEEESRKALNRTKQILKRLNIDYTKGLDHILEELANLKATQKQLVININHDNRTKYRWVSFWIFGYAPSKTPNIPEAPYLIHE